MAGVGTYTGSFTPTRFGNQNGAMAVTGLVTRTLTTLDGTGVTGLTTLLYRLLGL